MKSIINILRFEDNRVIVLRFFGGRGARTYISSFINIRILINKQIINFCIAFMIIVSML